jgi:hypothetical protein
VRTIVNVTPEYLAGLFDDHTSIQAQKLADTYIGKWMRVSGPLNNVSSFTSSSQVTFAPTGGVSTYMLFRNRAYVENRLSVLKRGDQITVLGRIDSIERHGVKLDNCELAE